jgi:alkyl hydroperoxide reductase subunit AhpF
MARQQKLAVYVSGNGARYIELPWPGMNRFRREGDFCPHCGTSDASHEVLGCELRELL